MNFESWNAAQVEFPNKNMDLEMSNLVGLRSNLQISFLSVHLMIYCKLHFIEAVKAGGWYFFQHATVCIIAGLVWFLLTVYSLCFTVSLGLCSNVTVSLRPKILDWKTVLMLAFCLENDARKYTSKELLVSLLPPTVWNIATSFKVWQDKQE